MPEPAVLYDLYSCGREQESSAANSVRLLALNDDRGKMSTQSPTISSQRSSHRSSDRRMGSSRAGSSVSGQKLAPTRCRRSFAHTAHASGRVGSDQAARRHQAAARGAHTMEHAEDERVASQRRLCAPRQRLQRRGRCVRRVRNRYEARPRPTRAHKTHKCHCSELLGVPEDLRSVLEQCLGEEATPANLDQYLPTVRQIITNLLQGLRNKQSIYRRTVADKEPSGSDRGSVRSSRATDSVDRDSSRSGRASSSRRAHVSASHSQTGSDGERFIGGFAPVAEEGEGQASPLPRRTSANASQSRSSPLSASAIDADENRSPRSAHSATRTLPDELAFVPPPPPPPLPQQHVPPEVKRYSLVDNPMPQSPSATAPEVVIDVASPSTSAPNGLPPSRTSTPPPSTPVGDPGASVQNSIAAQTSLAALKRSEALERRASKRFSTYTFSKMTGMGKDKGAAGRLAAGNLTLTAGDLEVLAEGDEDGDSPKKPARAAEVSEITRRSNSLRRARSTAPTPELADAPPVPPVPTPSEEKAAFLSVESSQPPQPASTQPSVSGPMQVFLQVGRQVKKVSIDPSLSFASLRVLFMDKFSYNPGQDNFPEIYIRDPSSGVQYELEDISEVKNKCLLCLNIERRLRAFASSTPS